MIPGGYLFKHIALLVPVSEHVFPGSICFHKSYRKLCRINNDLISIANNTPNAVVMIVNIYDWINSTTMYAEYKITVSEQGYMLRHYAACCDVLCNVNVTYLKLPNSAASAAFISGCGFSAGAGCGS